MCVRVKSLAILLALASIAITVPGSIAAAAPVTNSASGAIEKTARVDSVTARVTAGASLPPLVQARMQDSVTAIATQLLGGKKLSELQASRAAQERIIHEVFDKVLVGYTVERVTITPGAATTVEVALLPWSETIASVTVDTTVEGMPPRIERLVRADLAGVDEVFASALTGLPTAATDWTNGVLKHRLNDFLAEHLPEFRADFELEPDTAASVRLMIYPRLPVVRTVDLSMRSDTVPNFTLLAHRQEMQDRVNDLVGVPVDFVARHHDELAAGFAAELDSASDYRSIALRTTVSYDAAERLHLMSRSDTTRFRFRLTGWQDIARGDKGGHDKADNLNFRFHAGTMLSQQDELFALLDIAPVEMNWSWNLGYDRLIYPWLHGVMRYDMRAKRFIVGGYVRPLERVTLRYEHRFADGISEFGLAYQLHDFLAVEYALDNHQRWLRLIGSF